MNESDFLNLKFENVARVYSGKPGCMCGCRGKYSDSGRGTKIIFNKVMKGPFEFDVEANCAYLSTDSRILAVYFK